MENRFSSAVLGVEVQISSGSWLLCTFVKDVISYSSVNNTWNYERMANKKASGDKEDAEGWIGFLFPNANFLKGWNSTPGN